MEAFEVYFNVPGIAGSVALICENKGQIRGILSKKYDSEEESIEIKNINSINLEEIQIKDLDAQSFLNLMKMK